MKYLNLEIRLFGSAEYVGAEPIVRATWLNVVAWCAEQENAGRIVGAKSWKDRRWQQTCGVTAREVANATPLLKFDGDDLVVWEYPLNVEEDVQSKREIARQNGRKGGRPSTSRSTPVPTPEPTKQPASEPTLVLTSEPAAAPTSESVRESKVKEGKVNKQGEAALAELIDPSFPPILDTEHFRTQWASWLIYRRERKLAAYKPRTIEAQLAKLAEWGHDAALESIADSIRNNWQGLFPPKAAPVVGKPVAPLKPNRPETPWELRQREEAVRNEIALLESTERVYVGGNALKPGEFPGYRWKPGAQERISAARKQLREIQLRLAQMDKDES